MISKTHNSGVAERKIMRGPKRRFRKFIKPPSLRNCKRIRIDHWTPVLRAFEPLYRSELLIHLHKIKVVPGLDDLAVVNSRDRDTGEFNRDLRRREAYTIARV